MSHITGDVAGITGFGIAGQINNIIILEKYTEDRIRIPVSRSAHTTINGPDMRFVAFNITVGDFASVPRNRCFCAVGEISVHITDRPRNADYTDTVNIYVDRAVRPVGDCAVL